MRELIENRLRRALLLLGCLSACGMASAQTLTVRLVNATSGKPLPNKNITFQWGEGPEKAVVLVDKDGVGHVTVPQGTSTFILIGGPHTGGDPHRIAYANCNANALTPISVADVVGHGVAALNTCNVRRIQASPGEVVFWATPRSESFLGMH